MNKEEIEKKKKMLRDFSQQGQGQRVFFEEDLELIRDILQELEQKETILNKVTDKLKIDIKINNIECKNREMFREDIYGHIRHSAIRDYGQEVLNIIEGEKK